ncbi:YqgE/AlgH family protein [Nocardioides zeae]|uniref:UPF0301 protein RDV89_00555 n=1 Tax=Nocardioides imazamoxiresistens TaxID=3231893 RepID=A0ABU3PQS2_9ACTN|nr:YqgE/AlgH family protein [Nocardioides zeae]MDT9591536.1 YqgE/AlgH family protein [Nocardioides zeae]
MTSEPRAGMLLVATRGLEDPNFAESVVLLLDSDEDGALGVVVNRPSPVHVADVLEGWRDVVGEPDVLFRGGPVSPDGALALGRPQDPGAPPVGYREIVPGLGVLDLDTPVELVEGGLGDLRIFVGYAGWGPGQLEDEIAEGSWHVVAGRVADAFSVAPHDLWRDVLRRQPGSLAWTSTQPADPSLN